LEKRWHKRRRRKVRIETCEERAGVSINASEVREDG
jgi:hypothetical protein